MLNKFKKLLNWEGTTKPEVSISDELYGELRPFRLPIILLFLISMIGTLGYIAIDDMPLMDAIYQTGITFTTVGFGEIAPISEQGRVFTITLIILGFAMFSFSLGIIVEVINKGKLIKLLKERDMLYRIARLKNHFVIYYHNSHTIELSKQFRAQHIPFVVIDNMENFEEIAKKYKYPYYINDEPHKDITQRKAHLSSAKGAIILSENDADNIAQIATIRLFEKELKREPYYIVTISKIGSDQIKFKKLGADTVITPDELMAQRISATALRPDMHNLLEQFLYKRDTPLDLEEISVPKNSWLIFKKLKETHLRDATNVSVIGIKENNGKFIAMPKGDVQVTIGSALLVIGTGNSINKAKKYIMLHEKPEELKFV